VSLDDWLRRVLGIASRRILGLRALCSSFVSRCLDGFGGWWFLWNWRKRRLLVARSRIGAHRLGRLVLGFGLRALRRFVWLALVLPVESQLLLCGNMPMRRASRVVAGIVEVNRRVGR
jgi:hypothetical protein